MKERGHVKFVKVSAVCALALSVVALIAGILFPSTTTNQPSTISYDSIAPHVKDYLVKNNIIDNSGFIQIPNTSDEPSTVTIETAIDQLIAEGKFDYLKGTDGKDGAPGKNGANGTNGRDGSAVAKGDKGDKGDPGTAGAKGDQGDPGVISVGSGLNLTGGTLTLATCAVDQVLMMSSSLKWECATVSATGISTNTTNVSATLNLIGTSLQASITDSENGTINTPLLNLSNTFATDTELANALTTAIAGLNLGQYATAANLTSTIAGLNLGQYAKTTDMNTAINNATGNLVSQTDLTTAIASLNLGQFATAGNLTALTTRVGALEGVTTDNATKIATLVTDSANYVTNSILATTMTNYYTKSQTYSSSQVNNLVATKQDTLPACTNGQVIKYNLATSSWICANDIDTQHNLTNYATHAWVEAKNYATTASVANLGATVNGIDTRVTTLENSGFITSTALNGYLQTANLSTELENRLHAGTGVNITSNNGVFTINALAQTDVYEIVNDHTTLVNPSVNKIYIDTAANPATQWVYDGGVWQKIGEVNFDTGNYYTRPQADTAISNAVAANNANYTTTANLALLLDGKANNSALNGISTRVTTLENSGFITSTALNNYLQTSSLSTELESRIKAGTGIAITRTGGVFTITSTTQTNIYEIIRDHISIITPDPNKIYIDINTDPAEQWVYENSNWQMISQISFDIAGYYTAQQTDQAIEDAIATGNANYTTNDQLETLLAAKANQSALDTTNTRVTTLENSGYITLSSLNGYLQTSSLSGELGNRLAPGEGISITSSNGIFTIASTAQTDVYEIVADHLLVINPSANRIYIDTSTDPAEQWVYESSAWRMIGQVNADITGYYTKAQTTAAINTAVTTNNQNYTTTATLGNLLANKASTSSLADLSNTLTNNYTTTSDLAALLAGKQDQMPACGNDQVLKYDVEIAEWVCANDENTHVDTTSLATSSWVTGQITDNNNNYTTTSDLTTLLNGKADLTALATTNSNLSAESTARTTTDTALGNRITTIEADYLKSNAIASMVTTTQISDMATRTWTNNQGFLKSTDLAGYAAESWVTGQNYTTSTALNTALNNYYLKTEADAATATAISNYDTTAQSTYVPISSLHCTSGQVFTGGTTSGQFNCRAIQDINPGSTLTPNQNLITANTLNSVMQNYYTKTQIDNMNLVTGANQSYTIEVVTTLPATPDPNVIYYVTGN